jgi:hypothetical protein
MSSIPARPRTYHVAGRTPGTGPVVAVLTDGPADVAVAAYAADLAARTGTLLITAAAVASSGGMSVNALLHRARAARVDADTRAIVARVAPVLHSAGVAHFRTTLAIPAGVDAGRALPVTAVHHLIDRFGAVAVITAAPLHDPTGHLQPVSSQHSVPAAAPTASARTGSLPAHAHSLTPW